MDEKIVKIPDPILEKPKHKKMPWRKKAAIFFIAGFVGGWLWMTWATLLNHQVGSSGLSFWRLMLPF
jgi:hypothetical protein